MRPNRFDRTVVIPVRVVNGFFQYFYGGALPRLKERTIFDMIVPEWAIEDANFIKLLNVSHYKELLPKGAHIFAAVSPSQVPEDLRISALLLHSIIKLNASPVIASMFPDSRFVEIVLEESLSLQLRGSKHGRLKPTKCTIPSLKKQAQSLNLRTTLYPRHSNRNVFPMLATYFTRCCT